MNPNDGVVSGRKILFDLDGVQRDLSQGIAAHLGKPFRPVFWDENVTEGLGLCQYVSLYPEILINAPPTEFLPVYAEANPPGVILTCQPIQWIPYTSLWIKTHLPTVANVVWCQHPFEKLEIAERLDALLVEDYPGFPDNSRIVMVDRPYNLGIRGCFGRVRSADDLRWLLYSVNRDG